MAIGRTWIASAQSSAVLDALQRYNIGCDSRLALDRDCGWAGSVGLLRNRSFILGYSFGFAQSDAIWAGGYCDRDGDTGDGYGEGYVLSRRFDSGDRAGCARKSDDYNRFFGNGTGALTAYYGGDGGNAPARSAQAPMTVNSVAAQGFQNISQPAATNAIALQFPALAVGDFNGDGKLDVASTGAVPSAKTMVILTGNGDGTFQLGEKYTISGIGISAADFNGDGRLDLAVLSGEGTLATMLGNGDGTFQAPVNTAVHGERMVAADFNGDGVADLAVAESAYLNGGVTILLGKGDGTFAAPVSIPEGSGAAALAVADFNGDGMPDLAVQEGASSFQIYLGKGDGTFTPLGTPATVTGQISDIAAGDFNGDGSTDLAIGNNAGISLFEGNGDGTLGASTFTAIARPTLQLEVTDIDGDGHLDVIAETEYPLDPIHGTWGSFAVVNGDGVGGLTLNRFHDGVTGYGPFVLGDFNGDGRVDLMEGFSGPVTYLGLAPADLAVSLAHSGNPVQGQTGLTLTSTVTDLGPAAFAGRLVETFQVPDGLDHDEPDRGGMVLLDADVYAVGWAGGRSEFSAGDGDSECGGDGRSGAQRDSGDPDRLDKRSQPRK